MSYFKNPQQSPRLSVSEPLAQRSPQSGRGYLNVSRDFKKRNKVGGIWEGVAQYLKAYS